MKSPVHNVGGWLARQAQRVGERPAVVDLDSGRTLGYRALAERASRAAGWLASAGLGPGERVALLLRNRSAYLELLFAAAQLGAIAVPINARLTRREVSGLLDDCSPRVLVHEADLAELAGGGVQHTLACGGESDPYERALAGSKPHAHIEPVSPEDPMILMYTSGTTGSPKGALLPHRKTLYNSLNAALYFSLTGTDRVLVVLPFFHSFGLLILAVPALYAGATLALRSHFDADRFWADVEDQRITLAGGVPTMFRGLLERLEAAHESRDLDSLRVLFSAGAAADVETVRGFERHGLVLCQGYGQTETSILCCLDGADALRKAGSVGRPVFHADLRVVRPGCLEGPVEKWQDAATGEPGEIVVRGPITMLGYWRRPEATAETLRGQWLRTGDLATRDEEGFFTLVGRSRQMYISGGENVYPAEVETLYGEHPSLREIAVVGVPDPEWGEVGRAYVVLAAGATLDPEGLRSWGAQRLAGFKLPREFVAVEALPRTASGKVQKHLLDRDRLARPSRPS